MIFLEKEIKKNEGVYNAGTFSECHYGGSDSSRHMSRRILLRCFSLL